VAAPAAGSASGWALRTDGGARGNPGPAGAGFVLESPDGTVAARGGRYLGECTNNVAEYEALLWGLAVALEHPGAVSEGLTVYADSELIVKQMTGAYRVKHPNLKPLYERASRLASRFAAVRFKHVRREYNKEADGLANEAMDLREDVGDAPTTSGGEQGTLFS
jgi:ribonuclease HI